MPPEAAQALEGQVSAVSAACGAGLDLVGLQKLVAANPQDLNWDLHLIEALGNLQHEAIPPLLAALFGRAPDKPRRKALRRALHRLQTRGVPVPGDLLPREEPAASGRAQTPEVKSSVSPVLGNGDNYVVLEAPREIMGGNFLVALINDATGLLECHLLNMKSRQQEEFWEHYRQHGLSEWAVVPGPYAVRLLEEAFRADTAVAAAKNTYAGVRDKVWQHWGRPEASPDLEQLLPPLEPGEPRRLLEQARQLATHPLFQTWMPAYAAIVPWAEKLREVQQSPLVLSEAQQQARADALVDEATRAIYPPEYHHLWRRRLLAMAYFLQIKNQPAEAKMARAAADDLTDQERSAMAGENPFLQSLVQLALRLAWDETQKSRQDRGESGLLTIPGTSPLIRR